MFKNYVKNSFQFQEIPTYHTSYFFLSIFTFEKYEFLIHLISNPTFEERQQFIAERF